MILEMQEAAQLQKLTHIIHSRANLGIKFSLPQPLWNFRINVVNMFQAEHCQKVLLIHSSKQRDVYNIWGYPEPRNLQKYRAYKVSTLRYITVFHFTLGLGKQTGTQHVTVASVLTLMVPHHPPSWTQVCARFPRTSSELMNSLIYQEYFIY